MPRLGTAPARTGVPGHRAGAVARDAVGAVPALVGHRQARPHRLVDPGSGRQHDDADRAGRRHPQPRRPPRRTAVRKPRAALRRRRHRAARRPPYCRCSSRRESPASGGAGRRRRGAAQVAKPVSNGRRGGARGRLHGEHHDQVAAAAGRAHPPRVRSGGRQLRRLAPPLDGRGVVGAARRPALLAQAPFVIGITWRVLISQPVVGGGRSSRLTSRPRSRCGASCVLDRRGRDTCPCRRRRWT